MMLRLIPKIFYVRVEAGIDLFVDCLGFRIAHRDGSLVVVEREGVKAYLVEDASFAAKDRPELAIETDAIEQLYDEIAARHPELLHPNVPTIRMRPWGAREFALLDTTGVCVVVRQW